MIRPFHRWMLVASLLAGTSVGCASAGSGSAAGSQAGDLPQAPAAADVQFMSGMIHHHAQAIVMSDLADSHGASEAVRLLGQRIIVSQTDEIHLMQQWLRNHGQPVPDATATAMRMVVDGVEREMLMPGMLTDEEMTELDQVRGAEFDRLFLEGMIKHHGGALDMVDTLFSTYGGGVDDFMYKIASDMYADQSSEIGRMRRMLDAMGNGGS